MEHDRLSLQADASAENAKYLAIIGNSQNTITFFIALKTPGNVSSCHISWMNTGRLAYLGHTLPEIRERGLEYFRHYLHPADLNVLDETLKKLEKHKSEPFIPASYRAMDKFRKAYVWYYCQVSACDYFPDGSIREVQVNVYEISTDKVLIAKMTAIFNEINNLGLQAMFNTISRRQKEILALLIKGHTEKETAEILGISVTIVRTHHQRIRDTTKITHINELIALAIQSGLF